MNLNKKLIFITVVSILLLITPSHAFISKKEIKLYKRLSMQYEWLSLDLYNIILYESKVADFDPKLICSIIHVESSGENIISKQNKDGSYDIGYCQYNTKNMKKGEERLYLNPNLNIRSGILYFKDCIKVSNGRLDDSIRLYNQGINGKRDKYKNWKYVKKVFKAYSTSLNII